VSDQKSFRKIQGAKDLWILNAALGRRTEQAHVDDEGCVTFGAAPPPVATRVWTSPIPGAYP